MIFASSNSLQSCCSKILFPNSHVTFPCHPFKSSHFRRAPCPAVQSNEPPQCEPWLRSSPRNPHCRSVAGLRMEETTRRFWKILLQWMDEQLMIIELIQRHIQKVDGKKQQIGCHLNFCQGDRREAPIFLVLDDECRCFFVVRFFPRQCLWRYTDLQPLMILQHFQNQRYQRYHRRRFFFHWGWWEKHGIEIKDGGFFRFRLLTKSCVQLVTRMHIPSNMFKHHHWILISSTYPHYFGHIPYHWWCDFVWQWLNNQKHQKANVHQNVHQFHVTSICFSLTQLRNQNVCNGAAKRIAWISLVRTWDASRISHLSFLVSLIRWLPWCSLMVMLEAEMEKNFSLLVKDWNQG